MYAFSRLMVFLACTLLLLTAGCHRTKMAHYQPPKDDPFFLSNQPMMHFNTLLDRMFFEPVVIFYLYRIPRDLQVSINNFHHNILEPAIAFNLAVQRKWHASLASLTRFFCNTIWGLGGAFDVAAKHNLPKRITSFCATLKSWDVPAGPYIVFPIVGPLYSRDACGVIIDRFLNPGFLVNYTPRWTYLTHIITQRAEYNDILSQIYANSKNLTDLYTEFKSLSSQRAGVISQGNSAQKLAESDIF